MDRGQGPPFGELLRRYRVACGLTQEALAERAGLSVHLAPGPPPATFSMTPLDETTMRIEQCSS
jgi:transcriptional regulator with XRE-family HTH domain